MNHDKNLFSERLLEAIRNSYQTQSEIARKVKIHKGTLSMYCLGKRKPSPRTLIALCVILDCSPEWLRDGKGSPDDKFSFSRVQSPPVRKLEAHRIGELVEIKFIVPQKDFRAFFLEAERDGCIA